ncbi:MAG: YncE family protein [Caulobacteraceae bacterium]
MKLFHRRPGRFAATSALALLGCGALASTSMPASAQTPAKGAADYEFVAQASLGAPGLQDYLTFDPVGRRLYVSHTDQVTVLDAASDKVVGSVGPFHDSHGVAIVAKLGKGYADSGDDGVVKVFNLTDLRIVKEIKVSPDADGMVYDDKTGTVLVVAGDSKNLTVIDPASDTVTRTVGLPGKPEFLTLDGAGKVYVNLADVGAIAKVDIASGKVEATWPLAGCQAPHGLAYDGATRRLFSGCANQRLIVVDANDGRNLASLPIGSLSDTVVVDSRRGLAFSANADTLTVIAEGAGDKFSVARTIPTFFGGRSMAIDPATGTLYVAHGHMAIKSSLKDLLNLRFGWDGVDLAVFQPRS